jgi:hypothetical protein
MVQRKIPNEGDELLLFPICCGYSPNIFDFRKGSF